MGLVPSSLNVTYMAILGRVCIDPSSFLVEFVRLCQQNRVSTKGSSSGHGGLTIRGSKGSTENNLSGADFEALTLFPVGTQWPPA